MAATRTFTVDAIGSPEPVVAQSNCRKITVYENAQAGTVDYTVIKGAVGNTAVQRPAGSKTEFERAERESAFQKGDTVGYVATVSGSVTFAQEED